MVMELCTDRKCVSPKRKASKRGTPASKKRDVGDAVHGQINLPNICWKIIDTPQFQRLKRIKQLGTCYEVYPCAGHDRKQHSMGVCYLAGVYLNKLITNHAEEGDDLEITQKEKIMVQIAALCHDLGHGPFSHTFDGVFIPTVNPGSTWKHELASVQMFNRLLEANPSVKNELDKTLAPVDRKDYIFIEECLSGIPQGKKTDPWPFLGCGPEKAYLYEIVSNERCGVDVDRFDYIKRDCRYLKIKHAFDADRLMANTRVMEISYKGVLQNVLGFRDKMLKEIENLGSARASLHEQAYQHKVNKAVELMYVDALRLCDKKLTFKGTNGELLPLSQTINDMVAFERVDDRVIDRIKWMYDIDGANDPDLARAVEILNRVDCRQLYFSASQGLILRGDSNNLVKEASLKEPSLLVEDMCSLWSSMEREPGSSNVANLTVENLKESLIVSVSDIHHGMKDTNPATRCVFFPKDERRTVLTCDEKEGNAKYFREHIVRVFSRDLDDKMKQATMNVFRRWCSSVNGKEMFGDSLALFSSAPLRVTISHIMNTPPSSPIPQTSASPIPPR